MTVRNGLLVSTMLLGMVGLLSGQAQAGLLGAGRTVQAFYYNGVLASPEGELTDPAGTTDPKSLAAPVHYIQGSADGSTIDITDTQIIINNKVSGLPFCVLANVGTACTDVIDGFDFKFTGENILGVTVDPASSAGMLPATFLSHLGLQLISNNEIRVDVTGDLPLLNDTLVLNLNFTAAPPPGVPEPATLALLGSALVVLNTVRRRRHR